MATLDAQNSSHFFFFFFFQTENRGAVVWSKQLKPITLKGFIGRRRGGTAVNGKD